MTYRRLILAALALIAVAVPVRGAGDAVLLYPPDRMLTAEEKVKLLLFKPDGEEPCVLTVNGQEAGALEGGAFRAGEAPLVPGVNILEACGKTAWVFRLEGSLIDTFRLPTEKEDEPLIFQSYRLHPALDDGCESCHGVEGGKVTTKDQKEACYACHNDFEKVEEGRTKSVHNPVKAGECTSCHDPHFAARPKLQKLEKGCLECHDAFPKDGSLHYPVGEGHCVACHDPHAGPAPRQLVRPGNALCVECHKDPHPRHRSAEVRGMMTQVPSDFPRDKGDLACLGCHFPHNAPERRLFRKSQGELCKMCHLV